MDQSPVIITDRELVLAFRLQSHHLDRRLPPGSLLDAAGACGVQNTPPGTAHVSLYARVEGVTQTTIDQALESEKSLVQVWSMRQSPFIFPTQDFPVFTHALLPDDEDSTRFFILGAGPLVDRLGLSTSDLIARLGPALHAALDAQILSFNALSTDLADRVAERLSPQQVTIWNSPSGFAPGQTLGVALVHFGLRILAVQGAFCFAPREKNEALFVRTDLWLGRSIPVEEVELSRKELLCRYLHCYGPTLPGHFAEWAGIAPAQAKRAWRLVQNELVAVQLEGRSAWLLADDLSRLTDPVPASGVRFLPAHDPYLQQRDRSTLLPDQAVHRRVWLKVGSPGVVLVDGRVAAIWRPNKKGSRLQLSIEAVEPLTSDFSSRIESEAAALAAFRNCTSVEVKII